MRVVVPWLRTAQRDARYALQRRGVLTRPPVDPPAVALSSIRHGSHDTPHRRPPICILHGLFGALPNWRGFISKMDAEYANEPLQQRPFETAYMLDARNHGTSEHHPDMSYELMAHDLRAWMGCHNLSSAIWLGHSMGGKAVAQLALENPSLVSALIVVDIAPVTYDHNAMLDGVIRPLRNVDLSTLKSRADADATLAPHVKDPRVRGFLLTNLVHSATGYKWRVNLESIERCWPSLASFPSRWIQANTAGQGRTYDGPTLFIRGSASDYILPEHEDTIKALFPRAEIKTIEGAGHWVHSEKPAELAQVLHRFLQKAYIFEGNH